MNSSNTVLFQNDARTLRELEVFQFCDSTFPVGTFNHSFGMENFLSRRKIRKAADFQEWLKNYYQSQFRFGEGLAVLLSYDTLDREKHAGYLLTYDNILTAATAAYETRSANRKIAHQMITLLQNLYGDDIPHLHRYADDIRDGKAYGIPAIVFTLLAHWKEIPKQQAYLMYGYSVGSTLVQNAVRAIPLGQTDGQIILHKLILFLPELCRSSWKMDASYLGTSSPGIDIAQIRHETQPARLFMS
jgi:urease accessory protein